MDSRVSPPKLSRNERIAAIREKAQRHIYHSARVFTPPPEESDNSALPIPSLLAVACTAALANQAQAEVVNVSNEAELNAALANTNTSTIVFNNLGFPIKLTKDLLNLNKSHPVNLQGVIDGESIIDGNGHYAFLGVGEPLGNITNMTFNNLITGAQITGADPGNPTMKLPGFFLVEGDIFNSKFTNNKNETDSPDGKGGAAILGDSSTIDQSYFEGNSSKLWGGAIYTNNFSGEISNSSFINNKAAVGGAIYMEYFNGKIENSDFIGNEGRQGGAINFRYDGVGKIISSRFYNNHSDRGGR